MEAVQVNAQYDEQNANNDGDAFAYMAGETAREEKLYQISAMIDLGQYYSKYSARDPNASEAAKAWLLFHEAVDPQPPRLTVEDMMEKVRLHNLTSLTVKTARDYNQLVELIKRLASDWVVLLPPDWHEDNAALALGWPALDADGAVLDWLHANECPFADHLLTMATKPTLAQILGREALQMLSSGTAATDVRDSVHDACLKRLFSLDVAAQAEAVYSVIKTTDWHNSFPTFTRDLYGSVDAEAQIRKALTANEPSWFSLAFIAYRLHANEILPADLDLASHLIDDADEAQYAFHPITLVFDTKDKHVILLDPSGSPLSKPDSCLEIVLMPPSVRYRASTKHGCLDVCKPSKTEQDCQEWTGLQTECLAAETSKMRGFHDSSILASGLRDAVSTGDPKRILWVDRTDPSYSAMRTSAKDTKSLIGAKKLSPDARQLNAMVAETILLDVPLLCATCDADKALVPNAAQSDILSAYGSAWRLDTANRTLVFANYTAQPDSQSTTGETWGPPQNVDTIVFVNSSDLTLSITDECYGRFDHVICDPWSSFTIHRATMDRVACVKVRQMSSPFIFIVLGYIETVKFDERWKSLHSTQFSTASTTASTKKRRARETHTPHMVMDLTNSSPVNEDRKRDRKECADNGVILRAVLEFCKPSKRLGYLGFGQFNPNTTYFKNLRSSRMLLDEEDFFFTSHCLTKDPLKKLQRMCMGMWFKMQEQVENWSEDPMIEPYFQKITVMIDDVNLEQRTMHAKKEQIGAVEEKRRRDKIVHCQENHYIAMSLDEVATTVWKKVPVGMQLQLEPPPKEKKMPKMFPFTVNFSLGPMPHHTDDEMHNGNGAIPATLYVAGSSLVVFGGPFDGDELALRHRYIREGHVYGFSGELRHTHDHGTYPPKFDPKAKIRTLKETMEAMTIKDPMHKDFILPPDLRIGITCRYGNSRAVDLERGAAAVKVPNNPNNFILYS
jgi:hypothetical protein